MRLFCRAKSTLGLAPASELPMIRTLTLFAGVAFMTCNGTVATATTLAPAAIMQEHHTDKHDNQAHSESAEAGEIKIVIGKDGETLSQDILKKLKLEHLGQPHKHVESDGNHKVVVIQGDETQGIQAILKKIKSDHNIHIDENFSDGKHNIKVIMADDSGENQHALLNILEGKQKGQLQKLLAKSKANNNLFVVQGDDNERHIHTELHEHLAKIIHAGHSDKPNHHSIANKLRELADQLDGLGHESHSAHQDHEKIEHSIKINKLGKLGKLAPQNIEFQTDEGKHIVIGEPGQNGTMVIEFKHEGGPDVHAHGNQKKIVWKAKEHNADGHAKVEMLHVDGKQDSGNVEKKIRTRIKKQLPERKVVLERILSDNDPTTHGHESHKAVVGKTSDQGLETSIQKLKTDLEVLRKQIKKLQAERNRK